MTHQTINQPVEVTAVRFRNNMEAVPHRIEWGGASYTFTDFGLRYKIKKGNTLTQLLDLSDGHSKFRLRYDSDHASWQLLSISH